MQVVVLASQKGGAGKTTIAASIAVAAEAAGLGPVVMIDTDPQGTLTQWWQQRQAETPTMASIPVPELPEKIGGLKDAGFNMVIIDTPPAITASIKAVIGVATLVLIPVRPSPADLWAVGGTLALCREQDRKFAFVVSQASRGAVLTVQAMAALSEHGPVCGAILHHRVAFAGALASGRTLQETEPRNPGTAEITNLLAFIQERFHPRKIERKKGFVHDG